MITSETKPILRLRDVHRSFRSGKEQLHILRGIELTVAPGQIIAILGASGSGKSTLLHQMGALDRPDRGQILYGEADISQASEEERATWRNRYIGFIFQYHHLLAEFTAQENVEIPLLIAGVAPPQAQARAVELLAAVGLEGRRSHTPSRLSGGEQQRVALARALANEPPLILADEPTGNLDRATGEQLYKLLYSLARKGQRSWVVATHNEYLAKLADIRLRLEDGQLRPANGDGLPNSLHGSEVEP